jgi:hypothetical protein
MKPSKGRIVMIKGIQSNGSDEHPAIVNHVGGSDDGLWVNVTVFPDCGAITSRTSVAFKEDREAVEAYLLKYPGSVVCFWPPRES